MAEMNDIWKRVHKDRAVELQHLLMEVGGWDGILNVHSLTWKAAHPGKKFEVLREIVVTLRLGLDEILAIYREQFKMSIEHTSPALEFLLMAACLEGSGEWADPS